MSPFHKAILDNALKKALDLLKEAKDPVELAKAVDEKTGRLAIHFALLFKRDWFRRNAWQDFELTVKRHTDLVLMLISLYPDGLKVKDKDGNLPIHYAFWRKNLEHQQILFDKYPKCVRIKDSKGKLLLHRALELMCDDTFVRCLIDAFPKALEIQDNGGFLPSHFAVTRYDLLYYIQEKARPCLSKPNNEGRLPIHLACKLAPMSCIRFLVEAYPVGLQHPDDHGNLPIHYAVNAPSLTQDEFQWIIDQYPQGLLHKNNSGKRPISLCRKSDSKFIQLAKACPESLYDENQAPLGPLIDYLQKYGSNRASVLEEVLLATHHGAPSPATTERTPLLQHVTGPKKAIGYHQKSSVLELSLAEEEKEEQLNSSQAEERAQIKPTTADTRGEVVASIGNEKQNSSARKLQLDRSLAMYKKIAVEGRKQDQLFLAMLQDQEIRMPLQHLKSFAISLKKRVDIIASYVTPEAKPSMLQFLFDGFITNPNLSRAALIECIERLDAELTGLEADMEDADLCNQGISNDTTGTSTGRISEKESETPGRSSKRPRVSP